MNPTLQSVLIGTSGLQVMLFVALALTVRRRQHRDPAHRQALIVTAGWAIAAHCTHMVEEYLTGYYVQFPQLIDLAPWPAEFYVTFNLAWIGLWSLSLAGVVRSVWWALAPLWFLALGGLANGVAHPLFALLHGGYFPGLATAPLVAVAGWFLLKSLARPHAPLPRSR